MPPRKTACLRPTFAFCGTDNLIDASLSVGIRPKDHHLRPHTRVNLVLSTPTLIQQFDPEIEEALLLLGDMAPSEVHLLELLFYPIVDGFADLLQARVANNSIQCLAFL